MSVVTLLFVLVAVIASFVLAMIHEDFQRQPKISALSSKHADHYAVHKLSRLEGTLIAYSVDHENMTLGHSTDSEV